MNETVLAAAQTLADTRHQHFFPSDIPALATAVTLAASAGQYTSELVPTAFDDPAMPFVLTAVAAATPSTVKRDNLLGLGAAIPPDQRPLVLSFVEPFLARIDPAWAWSLLETLIGSETLAAHGALGLDIASRLSQDDEKSGLWPATWRKTSSTFLRQLQADTVTRAVVHGSITRKDAPEFAPLSGHSPGKGLLATEAQSYLIAAAALDSAWALEMADAVLRIYPPEDLLDAFLLIGQAAVVQGQTSLIVDRARRSTFIAEQACWTAVAAAIGALSEEALVEHIHSLVPRVTDELDAGRELIAGLPLLMALAHGRIIPLFVDLALQWRVPPPLLIHQLFHEELSQVASDIPGFIQPLLMVPEDEYCSTYDYISGWWLVAGKTFAERLSACQNLLTLCSALPWHPLPGSLADVTHWTARCPRQ